MATKEKKGGKPKDSKKSKVGSGSAGKSVR